MKMIILATKSCSHRHILENRLNEMQIPYSVQYFEDYPKLFEQHNLLSSPNIMVDDVVVFRAHFGYASSRRLSIATVYW